MTEIDETYKALGKIMNDADFEDFRKKGYVPPPDNPHAAVFRKMADDIMHNAANGFGGAFVIVPPADGGKPISVLLLDNANDAAQFWGLIGPKAQIALAELANGQRNQQAFPTRR